MIDLSHVRNYYVACGYTDLRRGIDGLASIVALLHTITFFTWQYTSSTIVEKMLGAKSRLMLKHSYSPLVEPGVLSSYSFIIRGVSRSQFLFSSQLRRALRHRFPPILLDSSRQTMVQSSPIGSFQDGQTERRILRQRWRDLVSGTN